MINKHCEWNYVATGLCFAFFLVNLASGRYVFATIQFLLLLVNIVVIYGYKDATEND